MKSLGALLWLLIVAPPSFGGSSITGTAAYRERISLPPDAVLEVSLEDVSRADARADVLGKTRIEAPGHPPIRFELPFDETHIQESHMYSVRARILSGERLMFITDRIYPVLTRGHGREVALILRKVGGTKSTPNTGRSPDLGSLPATFAGELPCADCPGIRYQLDLLPDQVFFRRMVYLDRDRSFDDIGTWALSPDRRTLVLKPGSEAAARFRVRDSATLRQLGGEGHEIASGLNYDLKRAPSLPPIEPRITMAGMYRYLADAALFTECLTRRRMPVALEQDNVALERAYSELRRQPGEEILAKVEGRIAMRPKMEGEGLQPTVIVDRFIELAPGETCGSQHGTADLENTYWRLTRLEGQPAIVGEKQQQPHLVLRAEDRRVSGSGGCNRLMGGYVLDGDKLSFGKLGATRMACPSEVLNAEQAFLHALEHVKTWKIVGEHLEMFGVDGKPLARFEALYLR